MCILSYLPAGIPVDEDGLWNGGINNPDGHGWALVADNRILVGKSLSLSQALDDFAAARKAHPNGDALFHSRWATHGSVSTANVHPFYVGGSKRTVVAHNGILPASAHPSKGDDRSDTRLFADEILSTRYRRLDKVRAMHALTQWIGSYNKLVILTVDDRYRHNAYVVNEDRGQWDDQTGIWHSNGDYLGLPAWWHRYNTSASTLGGKTSTGKGKYAGYSGDAVGALTGDYASDDSPLCLICNYGEVNAVGFCRDCGTCQDCFEVVADCMCYWQGAKTEADALLAEQDAWGREQAAADYARETAAHYTELHAELADNNGVVTE